MSYPYPQPVVYAQPQMYQQPQYYVPQPQVVMMQQPAPQVVVVTQAAPTAGKPSGQWKGEW